MAAMASAPETGRSVSNRPAIDERQDASRNGHCDCRVVQMRRAHVRDHRTRGKPGLQRRTRSADNSQQDIDRLGEVHAADAARG